jgi:hypothetical protein
VEGWKLEEAWKPWKRCQLVLAAVRGVQLHDQQKQPNESMSICVVSEPSGPFNFFPISTVRAT